MTRSLWCVAIVWLTVSEASAQFGGFPQVESPSIRSASADDVYRSVSSPLSTRALSAGEVAALNRGVSLSSTPEAEDRVEAVLATRARWDILDVTLVDLMDIIHKRFDVAVMVDVTSFKDEGIDPNWRVSLPSGTTSLETALKLALDSVALTIDVEGDVLVLTTATKANERLITRVYPVLDLVYFGGSPGQDLDFASLMQVIQQNTSGEWGDVDGVGGELSALPLRALLAVRQTREVHREIEGLLSALRRARNLQTYLTASTAPVHRGSQPLPDAAQETAVSLPLATPSPLHTQWQRPRVYRDE